MAGRIKGITVEIGGDTTKLQTALKSINTEIKNTQSQLKAVPAKVCGNTNTQQLLISPQWINYNT